MWYGTGKRTAWHSQPGDELGESPAKSIKRELNSCVSTGLYSTTHTQEWSLLYLAPSMRFLFPHQSGGKKIYTFIQKSSWLTTSHYEKQLSDEVWVGTDPAQTGLRGHSAHPVWNTKHASLQNSPQPTSPHPCPDLHLLTFNKETTFGRHSPDILPMLLGRRLAPHKEQSYRCKKEIKNFFSPYSISPLPPAF